MRWVRRAVNSSADISNIHTMPYPGRGGAVKCGCRKIQYDIKRINRLRLGVNDPLGRLGEITRAIRNKKFALK
jgi:hypothetical protein